MDLMQLTRAMLVNATKGSELLASEAKSNKSKKPDCGSDASLPTEGFAVEGYAGLEDLPHLRARIRRVGLAGTIVFWATIILGIVSAVDYQGALHSGANAQLVRQLWCVT